MSDAKTLREDQTLREDLTQRETAPQGSVAKPLETFKGYMVLKQLPATGGEADAFVVEKDGEKFFLKLYRVGIEPKEEVLRKTYELSQKMSEHVVKIHEYGYDQQTQRWYELQEYVERGNLAEYARSRGLIGNKDFAREVIRELSEAIHALHTAGIIHRDLKPANVLVRYEQPLDLVLTDFGISSLVDAEVSRVLTTVKGTFAYFAPESFSGYFGREVDWWAMGMIVLELLAGRNPLSGLSQQVIMNWLTTKPVPIPANAENKLKKLLMGLLTRDPKKRWGYEQIRWWLEGKEDVPVYYEETSREHSLEDWLKAGFTEQGARIWMEVVDDPELARRYKDDVGLTSEEVKGWVRAGIANLDVISRWKSAGFNVPEDVRIYEDLGLGPNQAKQLVKLGYNSKLVLFATEKLSFKYSDLAKFAKDCRSSGINLSSAFAYLNVLGFYEGCVQDIKNLIASGISPEELAEARIGSEDLRNWREFGFKELLQFRRLGFEPDEALRWRKAGLSPKEARNWRDLGFEPDEALRWRRSDFSPERAKDWRDLGFSLDEVLKLREIGYSEKDVISWKADGLTRDQVLRKVENEQQKIERILNIAFRTIGSVFIIFMVLGGLLVFPGLIKAVFAFLKIFLKIVLSIIFFPISLIYILLESIHKGLGKIAFGIIFIIIFVGIIPRVRN